MQDKGVLGLYESLACIGEGSRRPKHNGTQVIPSFKASHSIYPYASNNEVPYLNKEIRSGLHSPCFLVKRESPDSASIHSKNRDESIENTSLVALTYPGLCRPSQVPASVYDKKKTIRGV
jgi:hypothetical protein